MITFSISKVKSLFFQFFIIVFYALIFAKNYLESEGFVLQVVTATYVMLGAISTIYFYLKLPDNELSKAFITLMFVFSQLTSFFSPNYRYEDSLLSFSYFGLGMIPIFFKLNPTIFKFSAYVVILFFFYQMLNGVLPDYVFPRISRNFISVLLLIVCSYHIISCLQNEIRPSYFILFLCLIISIYAIGRGGIISFLVLTVFFPLTSKIKMKYKIIVIVSFLLFSLLGYFYFQTLLYENGLDRFDSMGLESERSSINSDYIYAVFQEMESVFFGADFKKIPSIVFVELNPHNSFIRLHVYYGIFGFLTLLGFLSYSFYYYAKKSYIYMLLLGVLLLRSFLDSSAFHGPFDPILFYLIYYSLQNKILV